MKEEDLFQITKQILTDLYQFSKTIPTKADPPIKGSRSDKYIFYNGMYIPAEIARAQASTKPNNFESILLENYWNLFEEIASNIEISLSQFAIRPLMELASNILSYTHMTDIERQAAANKFFLCFFGKMYFASKEQHWLNDYNRFLVLLKNPKDKQTFEQLRDNGFNEKEINKLNACLFPPSAFAGKTDAFLKDFFGDQMDGKRLTNIYNYAYSVFSSYLHGHLISLVLYFSETKNKKYIFRMSKTLVFAGLLIAQLSNGRLNQDSSDTKNKLQDIKQRYEKIRKDLYLACHK